MIRQISVSASRIFLLTLATTLLLTASSAIAAVDKPEHALINEEIRHSLKVKDSVDLLILLDQDVILDTARTITDKQARGRWVYDSLRKQALRHQQPLIAELDRLDIRYQQFWIVNAIRVTVNSRQLDLLLKRQGRRIEGLVQDKVFRMQQPSGPVMPQIGIDAITTIEWGVQRVEAPWAWENGFTGQGVVIAGQDTGYQWDHPALQQAYRGYNAVLPDKTDHNYNWHDAIHSNSHGTNLCGIDSQLPCDDGSHGTHTMGTMVGNDLSTDAANWPAGAVHAVGVAPGADWIGCRNMDNGWGLYSTYIECFEWLTAPYPFGGDPLVDGNPDKAPSVISNSWYCPPTETCLGPEIEPAVNAADAAGILVVVSAGNNGSSCGTVYYPPAFYPRAFSVGATDSVDRLASFSSRGPGAYDGDLYAKPNISAPGVSVYSTIPAQGYSWKSGTSMASPHVAGVAALLLSAAPELKGRVDLIKAILERTADPMTSNESCGADPTGIPNNSFGWGIVNARSAIESLAQSGTVSGTVTNALGGEGVDQAMVSLIPLSDPTSSIDAITTSEGVFLASLPWGDYELQVAHNQYFPETVSGVMVVGGKHTAESLQLTPIVPPITTLSIERDAMDVVLSWQHSDASVAAYEVWRAIDQAHFRPELTEGERLATIPAPASGEMLSFRDNYATLDLPEQASYMVIAVSAQQVSSPSGRRAGEWSIQIGNR